MALGDNKVLGFFGPGGGAKMSIGTCVVGDTCQSRLSRVEVVIMTVDETVVSAGVNDEPAAATGLNTTSGAGSFLADGHSSNGLFWLAIGK